jgi:transposase
LWIDLNLESFVTITSETETLKIEYLKYFIKAEERLKRVQRQLSRKKEDPKNWGSKRMTFKGA